MAYLTTLEQLLPIAEEVFLHDLYFERLDIVSSYRHARVYLRRIIDYARREPFTYKISLRQLARIIGVTKASFIRWFCHNEQLRYTSRQIFRFIRNLIQINCRKALRARGIQGEYLIEWPSKKTIAAWKRIAKQIRDTHLNREPVISNEGEAEEVLQWMLSGFSSSSSSSIEDEFGENAEEVSIKRTYAPESTDNLGLNGNPDIPTNQELIESFGKMVVDEEYLISTQKNFY